MTKIDDLMKMLCPDGVAFSKMEDLGDFYGGLTGKSKDDFVDGNANFITYVNVFNNPSLNLSVSEKVRILEGEKQRKIEFGDVIFTGSSETPDECAFSSVVTEVPAEDYYLNSFCFIWRLKDKSIFNPHFLKHLFRSSELRKKLIKTASGVTRFNVSKEKMRKIEIPIPPLNIQNEIVYILDNFTELTAELTARKIQNDYYRNLLLNFESTCTEWVTLNEVMTFKNGVGHKKSVNESGDFIIVNSKFISTNGQIAKHTSEQLCPLFVDDILMVMSDLPNGKALAKCFLVEKDNLYSLNGLIKVGDRVFIKGNEDEVATVIDDKKVNYNGEEMSYNTFGCKIMGWKTIQIYSFLITEGETKTLGQKRQEKMEELGL